MHSADKLCQHALQNIHCIKEAAKGQNSGQAYTVEVLCKAVQGSVHFYASLFFIEMSRGNYIYKYDALS